MKRPGTRIRTLTRETLTTGNTSTEPNQPRRVGWLSIKRERLACCSTERPGTTFVLVGGNGGTGPNQPGGTVPTGYKENGMRIGLFLAPMAKGNSQALSFLPQSSGGALHRP